MEKHPAQNPTTGAISAVALQETERALTKDRKGRQTSRVMKNRLDPAFDPITAALRQMHDGVTNEPIPDDFLRLLDEIDDRISAQKKPS